MCICIFQFLSFICHSRSPVLSLPEVNPFSLLATHFYLCSSSQANTLSSPPSVCEPTCTCFSLLSSLITLSSPLLSILFACLSLSFVLFYLYFFFFFYSGPFCFIFSFPLSLPSSTFTLPSPSLSLAFFSNPLLSNPLLLLR